MIKLISTFVLVFTTIICNSQIKGSGKPVQKPMITKILTKSVLKI
jgi:hypothetical protein